MLRFSLTVSLVVLNIFPETTAFSTPMLPTPALARKLGRPLSLVLANSKGNNWCSVGPMPIMPRRNALSKISTGFAWLVPTISLSKDAAASVAGDVKDRARIEGIAAKLEVSPANRIHV